MSAVTRLALTAAVIVTAPAGAAVAGAMPPDHNDDPPVRVSEPAPVVSEPVATPRALAPAPEAPVPDAAPPLPASAFTVTYAETVGLIHRYGYESAKEDAALYCAQYGRVATLDTRFEVGDTWYVRFNCTTP